MDGPRILVLYSSADDAPLRLDKERRALDKLLDRTHNDRRLIHCLHAVTVRDFIDALRSSPFEVIQFSGHGDANGIYFQTDDHAARELVDAGRLATILEIAQAPPRVLLLLSCFSSASSAPLAGFAPFIVSLTGEADDESCIEFVISFYETYLGTGSAERAFEKASRTVEAICGSGQLVPVLSRRAGRSDRWMRIAVAGPFDFLQIDTASVEEAIRHLGLPLERFLATLCRKIQVHRWIFELPCENAVLPLGEYFGILSWEGVDHPVVLRRLLRLRDDIPVDDARLFAELLISYTELRILAYRSMPGPASGLIERSVKKAIEEHHSVYEHFFKDERMGGLTGRVPAVARTAQAMIGASLAKADAVFHRDDLARAVAYLEASLTAFHDLVDAMIDAVTVSPGGDALLRERG